ncbi:RagB/SusD family nutrient uptake outer membrane protein [Pseudochryseolinea flava]|uniref:RagB/SusD family nutrient uptake outer membrane protein n=1 Tax=Pseudochryseolinea flava TaxID=2059302 RepID=A0A364Y5K4_9BACT|nr:RagB/SusD family nutrient uptake outer membrane protein [Pseudochryseolinea flava]RAW02276.1 RagB/SusD family nutrient uptake outer membrane protein [Pseudochryseolinea flava]
MKRLRLKNIVTSILFSSALFACTDLDEKLYDSISADETALTASDLNTIIAPAYANLREVYWHWNGLFDVYEESSDLIVTPFRVGIGWGDLYLDMHKHTWGPAIEHGNNLWVRTYAGINLCNKAAFQIEQLGAVDNKEAVLAELRALRAFYYYLLLDNFRNVPIVTRFDVEPGFLPEQNTGQEVYDFIEGELTEVMPQLSVENTQKTYGRFTQWAAKMVLAKLYLNSEVYINTDRYDDALLQVNDIISSNKFSLLASYKANFAVNNTNTPEEIFSIPFSKDFTGNANTYYQFKTLHPLSASTFNMPEPWGGSCGIPQFIDTYDEDDVRLKDCWLGGPQFSASGSPIMVGGEQFEYINYMTSVDEAEYNEGFRFVKYEIPIGFTSGPDNDVPLFRYTDALMMKAECLLRTGGASGATEAAEIVTAVRQRAFPATPAKAIVSAEDLAEGSSYAYGKYEEGVVTDFEGGADIEFGRLLDELAWEFVGEHHRKQDLIRFGVYTTKSWLTHVPNGNHRVIFPIPQQQRETNLKLEQNDGY